MMAQWEHGGGFSFDAASADAIRSRQSTSLLAAQ
jgi:hypothetical protein